MYTGAMKIEDTVFVYRLNKDGSAQGNGGSAHPDRLSWHGRYHAHTALEFEIHFFLEGSGSFLCNQTRYPISGGRLFLTGPREFHSILPEAVSSPLTYYAVLFSFDEGEESLLGVLRSSLASRQTVLSIDQNFRFQFEDLLQMAKSSDPALIESALHLLTSFLYRWFGRQGTAQASLALKQQSDLSGESRISGKNNRMHTEKALAMMKKSVRENVRVEDFARKLGLSDEHFIRIFGDEVHMTPHQYFIRLKVEGASGLLISTDKPIGEISAWFGFENQFHFSRVFRKCTGMSPAAYRQTYLQIVDFT